MQRPVDNLQTSATANRSAGASAVHRGLTSAAQGLWHRFGTPAEPPAKRPTEGSSSSSSDWRRPGHLSLSPRFAVLATLCRCDSCAGARPIAKGSQNCHASVHAFILQCPRYAASLAYTHYIHLPSELATETMNWTGLSCLTEVSSARSSACRGSPPVKRAPVHLQVPCTRYSYSCLYEAVHRSCTLKRGILHSLSCHPCCPALLQRTLPAPLLPPPAAHHGRHVSSSPPGCTS